jgi:hypothetical protein
VTAHGGLSAAGSFRWRRLAADSVPPGWVVTKRGDATMLEFPLGVAASERIAWFDPVSGWAWVARCEWTRR